jgi:hypothetical protein
MSEGYMEKTTNTRPSPDVIYPMPQHKRLVYLKNIIFRHSSLVFHQYNILAFEGNSQAVWFPGNYSEL